MFCFDDVTYNVQCILLLSTVIYLINMELILNLDLKYAIARRQIKKDGSIKYSPSKFYMIIYLDTRTLQ